MFQMGYRFEELNTWPCQLVNEQQTQRSPLRSLQMLLKIHNYDIITKVGAMVEYSRSCELQDERVQGKTPNQMLRSAFSVCMSMAHWIITVVLHKGHNETLKAEFDTAEALRVEGLIKAGCWGECQRSSEMSWLVWSSVRPLPPRLARQHVIGAKLRWETFHCN